MKALDANVVTQIDAQQRKARLLFEMALTGLTLRYAANISNITFPNGDTVYTAKAILFGGVSQSLEGQICRINVKFDNVATDMAAYVNTYEFEGRYLTIKRIFLDASNNAPAASTEYAEVFHGKMEQPKDIGRQWLTVSATEGKPLNKQVLNDIYGKECRHTFGVGQCNKDGNADLTSLTASGTADSGTISTLVHTALTQADDYWNYGKISVTKSGTTYIRKVKDFVANISSQGTITMAGVAVADETFVIDSQTFTWKASRVNAGEVTIGANAAAAVTNIVTAVTADLATVTAVDGAGDTVVVTAATAGSAGNSIVFTEASTNMAVDGAGTLGTTTAGADSVTTFDIALPVAVDNTTTYVLLKGCPKTWDACQANSAFGPSADNKLNFGGHIHIGIWREN